MKPSYNKYNSSTVNKREKREYKSKGYKPLEMITPHDLREKLRREELEEQQMHQRNPPISEEKTFHSIRKLESEKSLVAEQFSREREKGVIRRFIANQNLGELSKQEGSSSEDRKIANEYEDSYAPNPKTISQCIYHNGSHVFAISRGKDRKHGKFIDIEVHCEKKSFEGNFDNPQENTYYRCTYTDQTLPQMIRKYAKNTNILYSKLFKQKNTLEMYPQSRQLKFVFFDQAMDSHQQLTFNMEIQCFRSLWEEGGSSDVSRSKESGLCQRFKRRCEYLQHELKVCRSQLSEQRLAKKQIERQIQSLELLFTKSKQQLKESGEAPLSKSEPSKELQQRSVGKIGELTREDSSVVEILDDSDDGANQELHSADVQSKMSASTQPVGASEKSKARRKEKTPLAVFEHQTCEPGKFVHAVNGKTLSVNQLLGFKATSNGLEPKVEESVLQKAKNSPLGPMVPELPPHAKESFEDRLAPTSHRTKAVKKYTCSAHYGDRKLVWREYSRNCGNSALVAIMEEESEFAECKELRKPGIALETMGWTELFLNVLKLDLSDNRIARIEGLYNLKKLKELALNKNLLVRIENLADNRELRELSLRENQIEALENIFHLKKLESLSLQNNLIKDAPELMAELISLRVLHLNGNRLARFPQALLHIPSLRTVRIFGNRDLNLEDSRNRHIKEELERRNVSVYSIGSFE